MKLNLKKFLSGLVQSREKATNGTVEGGFDVLQKMIAPEMGIGGELSQYEKSLYVFACVSKIAGKVKVVPTKLFKVINSKGDTKEVVAHPALDLLYKPNPFQTRSEFLEITEINLRLTGDAFWFKVRNNGGRVIEIWNMRPDFVTIITDPEKFIKGYEFSKSNGRKEFLVAEDVVHHRFANPSSDYTGMSPLRPAKVRIQTEQFASEYQRDFFLNSARPDAIIKNKDSFLTRDQKSDIREGFEKRHRGRGNNSKIGILDGGLEYQQISISQKEMDYIESLKFTRDDILVAFGVPKPIVAITDEVNYANAETAMRIFLSEVIAPEVKRMDEKINEELIYPDFGEEFYIQSEDPTPENRELTIKEYESGITQRYLLINEVRQRENLPPIKGGWSIYGSIAESPIGGLSSQDKSILDREEKANEKAITKFREDKESSKKYDFRGRYWFQKKLEMKEQLEAAAKNVVDSVISKRKSKKHKVWKPLISEKELKAAYAGMVNKQVDGMTDNLKPSVNKFAEEQKKRVLAKMDKLKSIGRKTEKKVEVKIDRIFNSEKETNITIQFITPFLEGYVEQAAKDALGMVAPQEDFQMTKRIQSFITKRAKRFAEEVNSTTLEGLESTLAEGIEAGEGIAELSNRVNEVYDDFPAYRSELIARTEATAANNQGMLEGFKQSDVATGKEWINAGDGRVRDEHQDQPVGVGGEIVGLEENFSNGLSYPSEPNCRCVIGPAFLEG